MFPSVVRVAILSEQFLVRAGLRWILEREPGFTVVGELDQVRSLESACELSPHILIIHLERNGTHLPRIPRHRKETSHDTRILVLTTPDKSASNAFRNIEADHHLPSDIGRQRFLEAFRELAHTWGFRGEASESQPICDLSGRERHILDLISAGYTNKEIAEQLTLSVRTIETHRSRIRRKLRARSRADLVRRVAGVNEPGEFAIDPD